MNIVRTDIDPVNATLAVHIDKNDYAENVEKKLREHRRKANIPGFRPGMVPMGFMKKMYGKAVMAEEINTLISENLYKYIDENNIECLGEPLPNETEQSEIDLEIQEEFDFMFDIGIAPAFDVEITDNDTVPYYKIEADEEMIDQRIKYYASQYGERVLEETVEDRDKLKGEVVELENGEPKADGIKNSEAIMMPSYMSDEEQKALFIGAKKGDEIVFNPSQAFNSETEIASLLNLKKDEVKNINSDFKFTIEEITRHKNAEINQALFDNVYGEGIVKNEEEFRNKTKDILESQLIPDCEYKFEIDVRAMLLAKYKDLQFPEAFLKRWLQVKNKELTAEKIEEDYPKIIEDLRWQLIAKKISDFHNIKVEEKDIEDYAKALARTQFRQYYGMADVPDEYIEGFAKDLLKEEKTVKNIINRAGENKVMEVLKTQVKLDRKTISMDDFNKLFENK